MWRRFLCLDISELSVALRTKFFLLTTLGQRLRLLGPSQLAVCEHGWPAASPRTHLRARPVAAAHIVCGPSSWATRRAAVAAPPRAVPSATYVNHQLGPPTVKEERGLQVVQKRSPEPRTENQDAWNLPARPWVWARPRVGIYWPSNGNRARPGASRANSRDGHKNHSTTRPGLLCCSQRNSICPVLCQPLGFQLHQAVRQESKRSVVPVKRRIHDVGFVSLGCAKTTRL
jgi:hypothetical protein